MASGGGRRGHLKPGHAAAAAGAGIASGNNGEKEGTAVNY